MYENPIGPFFCQRLVLSIFFLIYLFLVDMQCYLIMVYNLHLPSDYDGEGNGTPLQYSFLENPMDGEAW